MLKAILKHLENRRKWNRTRAWMRQQATSRAVIGLVRSGCLTIPRHRLCLWGLK